MRFAILGVSAILLAGCGNKTVSWDEFHSRTVTLPDNKKIVAEVMTTQQEMARGMMFRDTLAENRGMLFIHAEPGRYGYWMYQVRIPLDIIWMDENRRIVEIAPNVPGCEGPPEKCRSYGGVVRSMYVLELAGGVAAKHALKVGDTLRF